MWLRLGSNSSLSSICEFDNESVGVKLITIYIPENRYRTRQ